MKRFLSKYSLMIALAAFSAALFAAPVFANWGKESSAKKVAHMKKELLLTDDQASQMKTICDETMDKMKALHEEKEARINAILTPEQKKKYAEEMDEMKEKHRKDKDDDKEEKEDKD